MPCAGLERILLCDVGILRGIMEKEEAKKEE